MLPLLELLGDGRERKGGECLSALQSRFDLTPEELSARIASGANLFASRFQWVGTYLVKAGALARPSRGVLQITERGRQLLSEALPRIDTVLLEQRYEEMRSWRRVKRPRDGDQGTSLQPAQEVLSPEESFAASYQQIREAVEADILDRAKGMPPDRFEQLVLDLLLKLGYGGPFGAGVHLGKTGDGGVDGVIRQDKLGLELIYVQAKRWQGTVGSSAVREFAGSLSAHRARKGVIITTSSFTADAQKDAERMGDRIVLISGTQLAALMYEVGLGVSVTSTFDLKRPDSDYFEITD